MLLKVVLTSFCLCLSFGFNYCWLNIHILIKKIFLKTRSSYHSQASSSYNKETSNLLIILLLIFCIQWKIELKDSYEGCREYPNQGTPGYPSKSASWSGDITKILLALSIYPISDGTGNTWRFMLSNHYLLSFFFLLSVTTFPVW